ncbi:hypothetical protein WG68_04460 [Arsukibacterium ikkense]|uniref:Uncharacterized protein n=1 Tax=Arsukibacterium ikkense TaxID=336831 RepID=A0A0M2VBR0_9GAMM|nr:hypothetical protein [Arsukibacterium ikkense]KKO46563.1 hypothetical protein WG68_04460 [Arsukibacterium ikkense]
MRKNNNVLKALTINTYYSRSVNVERDLTDEEVIRAYIPTARAKETLNRLLESANSPKRTSAFSLIGPYGSGKSSFAVFLTQLLAAKDKSANQTALNVLTKADAEIAKGYKDHLKSGGYLPLVLSGNPEPLSRRLIEAIRAAAIQNEKMPEVVDAVDELRRRDYSHEDIKQVLALLQQRFHSQGGQGLLLIIDEFGKFLEYDARHSNSEDIHLLQIIAEASKGSDTGRILFFVLLHQAFDQYAKGMSDSLKKEWSKIQGRFETIPFLESTEQTLKILANSFSYQQTAAEQAIYAEQFKTAARYFLSADLLKTSLDETELAELLQQCYPLHPITALILPQLCQKVAQNERTLFSFIGSHEPFGFRELAQNSKDGFIGLGGIYDYFIANQSGAITDSLTQKRWYEVLSAVDRLGDAESTSVSLLKAIGLLNIVGVRGGFKASEALLQLLFGSAFEEAKQTLINKSLIVFRRYSQEYAVWQGSDFDLDGATEKAKNEIGQFSLAERLNNQSPLEPIIARKYSFEKAALRYFMPVFADISSYKNLLDNSEEPRLVIVLLQGAEDQKQVKSIVKQFADQQRIADVLLFCPNATAIADSVLEVLALKQVQQYEQLLKEDRVALREFSDRLYAAEMYQRKVLKQVIDETAKAQFFAPALVSVENKLGEVAVNNRRAMQALLSQVLEHVYPYSPIIRNELINREVPSPQANLGKKNLLLALQQHSNKEAFGIEKFPPEKGIYLAIFRESGLHTVHRGCYSLSEPDAAQDNTNIIPVWQVIKEFFESTKNGAKGFDELEAKLIKPPYGVKSGVLSIFYVTAMTIWQDKLAIFEEGVYQPDGLTPMRLQIFLKNHKYFKVQLFTQANMQERFLDVLATKLGFQVGNYNLLDLTKQIMTPILAAHPYTQNTENLSEPARQLRHAVKTSNTPQRVLVDAIPKIFNIDATNNESVNEGLEQLLNAVKEIKLSYSKMLQHFAVQLGSAFSISRDTMVDLKDYVLQIKQHVSSFGNKFDGLLPEGSEEQLLINALKFKADIDEPVDWLIEILTVIGRISPEKWTDRDVETVTKRLRKIHAAFADAMELLEQEDSSKKRSNLFFVKSLSSDNAMRRQAVAINDKQVVQAQQLADDLSKLLKAQNVDESVITAALCKLIGQVIHE